MKQRTVAWKLGMVAGMIFLLSGSYSIAQQIGYVDISVGSEGNGASWTTAFQTLTNALTRTAGTSTTTLYVAQGTYYTPTALGTDITTNSLYGGYPTGGGTRDWTTYPTILDGGNSNRVLQKSGARPATLNGFTVRNGVNNPNTTHGAGIYCTAGSLNIRNCLFTNNVSGNQKYGGAVYSTVQLIVQASTFTANQAGLGRAGGIFITAGATVTNVISNCVFTANVAYRMGGCLYLDGGCCGEVYDSSFVSNKVTTAYQGVANGGGHLRADWGPRQNRAVRLRRQFRGRWRRCRCR